MSREDELVAHRLHMDIFQKGAMAVADEIISRDFIWHARSNPREWRRGPEGVKKAAMAIRTAFPDAYYS